MFTKKELEFIDNSISLFLEKAVYNENEQKTLENIKEKLEKLHFDESAKENKFYFITAYEVSRCFGGYEEGGWWWNIQNPLETISFDPYKSSASEFFSYLNEKYSDIEEGNIDSVLGGTELMILCEESPQQFAQTIKPKYE